MKRSIHNRILGSVAIFLSVTTGMVSAQTGKTYSQLKMEHPDWVQIPGELIRPDCVHAVPKGAHIEIGEDGQSGDVTLKGAFVAHYDPCPEAPVSTRHIGDQGQEPGPTGNGWVEASQEELSLKSSDNIDFMYGLSNRAEGTFGEWRDGVLLQWYRAVRWKLDPATCPAVRSE